jgi:ATP-dependent Clp protease ATP-binding subunit ClpA
MFFWLLKYIVISFSLIYLAHKLVIYLQNKFTKEKEIDLVDIPEIKYKNILNTLQNSKQHMQEQSQEHIQEHMQEHMQEQSQEHMQEQSQEHMQEQSQEHMQQKNNIQKVKLSDNKEHKTKKKIIDTSIFKNMENELQDFLKVIDAPDDKIQIYNK